MLRLLKFARLLKLKKMFIKYKDAIQINRSVLQITKLVSFMLFFAHLFSCLIFGITSMYDINQNSWMANYCPGGSMYCINKVIADTNDYSTAYKATLYWTITTMTTVGFGCVKISLYI